MSVAIMDLELAKAAAERMHKNQLHSLEEYAVKCAHKLKQKGSSKQTKAADGTDGEDNEVNQNSDDEEVFGDGDGSDAQGVPCDSGAQSSSSNKRFPPVPGFTPPSKRARSRDGLDDFSNAGSDVPRQASDDKDEDDTIAIVRLPGPRVAPPLSDVTFGFRLPGRCKLCLLLSFIHI